VIPEQTEEQRQAVQAEARRLANMFSNGNDDVEHIKNPYALKMERMQIRAKANEVLIEESHHKMDGLWVPREQAVQENVNYVDPVKWVTSRMKEEGRFGTIKRAF
jgi:hypothetical protein